MKDISIIIVSWNARDFLRGCVNSINETCQDLDVEIIVVDNASSDGSAEMVRATFPEVTLELTGHNQGFAQANNIGIKMARGEYYAFINSDVIVHPGCLAALIAFLQVHPDVGLVGPRVSGGDGKLQRTCRRLPTVWNTFCRAFALDSILGRWPLFSGREMRHWNHESQDEVEVISGCFWVARRAAVERVGGLDERFFFYAEDVDWCKRFRNSGWKVAFVPGATATHFGGASSSNAPLRYSIEMLRANLAYWGKYSGAPGKASFYLLSIAHHGVRILSRGLRIFFSNHPDAQTIAKFRKSLVCLRWLLTGREVAGNDRSVAGST